MYMQSKGDMRAFLETEKAFEAAEAFAQKSKASTPLSDVTLLAPIDNPRCVFALSVVKLFKPTKTQSYAVRFSVSEWITLIIAQV